MVRRPHELAIFLEKLSVAHTSSLAPPVFPAGRRSGRPPASPAVGAFRGKKLPWRTRGLHGGDGGVTTPRRRRRPQRLRLHLRLTQMMPRTRTHQTLLRSAGEGPVAAVPRHHAADHALQRLAIAKSDARRRSGRETIGRPSGRSVRRSSGPPGPCSLAARTSTSCLAIRWHRACRCR